MIALIILLKIALFLVAAYFDLFAIQFISWCNRMVNDSFDTVFNVLDFYICGKDTFVLEGTFVKDDVTVETVLHVPFDTTIEDSQVFLRLCPFFGKYLVTQFPDKEYLDSKKFVIKTAVVVNIFAALGIILLSFVW